VPADPLVLSWDDAAQRLTAAPMPPSGKLLPALDLSQPSALPQLLEGFEPLYDGYRPIRDKARVTLAVPSGVRRLELDWRVDEIAQPDALIVWMNGKQLGHWYCDRPGPYQSVLPVREERETSAIVELGAGARVSLRSIAFR
jgi:hypothetical protein